MYDTVGAMYVRVVSDTSGIKGELERAYGAEGSKAAKAFDRNFQNDLNKRLTGSQVFGALDKRIKTWAQSMAAEIGDAVDFSKVDFKLDEVISAAEINKISKRLRIPAQELADYLKTAMPQALRAAQKEQEAGLKRYMKLVEENGALERKFAKQLGDDVADIRVRTTKDALDAVEVMLADHYKNQKAYYKKVEEDEDKHWRRRLFNLDVMDKRVGRWRSKLKAAGTGGIFDTLTSVLGGMLGLAFKVGKVVPDTLRNIGFGFQTLGEMAAQAGGRLGKFAGPLSKVGGALVKVGGSGAGTIAAFVVGIGVLQALLGSLSVLLSTVTAGLVAFGSALLYAVSNVALLVPIAGALGVGFAGLAIGALDATQAIGKLWAAVNETDPKKKAAAWKEYNRELEKLGPNARAAVGAMKPLVEQFSDLKKQAGEALFEGMADALKKATPLVESLKTGLTLVAGAVGNVIEKFLGLAQNTQFMSSFNYMWALSASIIDNLGTVAANLFAGFTNFFSAIGPLVTRFMESLVGVSEEFLRWTESAEGRWAILDFFTKAYEIGSLVWGVVKELALALFDLFTADATTNAAKDLFGFLLEEVQKFRDWINEISENGKLAEWFADAKEVGKALWGVVKELMGAFASLNNDENKTFFLFLLSIVRLLIAGFKIFATMGRIGIMALSGPLKMVTSLFNAMSTAVGWVIDKVQRLIDKIKGWPIIGRMLGGGGARSGGGGTFSMASVTQITPSASGAVVNYWNITTPSADSRVVASQVMNRMAAMAG